VARWDVCTKSPATGCFAKACSGGDFGAWIKFAGYDFILIEGKADKPVYLYIKDGKAELKDAAKFWGKNTYETIEEIRKEYDDQRHDNCQDWPLYANGC
jgi:aldehyde:ferredoxin oxidoreductase